MEHKGGNSVKLPISDMAEAITALAASSAIESENRDRFISDVARTILVGSESDRLEADVGTLSTKDVARAIAALSSRLDDSEFLMPMAALLGIYMMKLNKDHGFPPVFPLELLPLPKPVWKNWGFRYAALVVRRTGKLLQYQQKGVLCYTSFQSMSKNQWEEIHAGTVNDLVRYNVEMRDQGTSKATIPLEYKSLIDAYRREFDAEASELLQYIEALPANRSGCASVAVMLSLIGVFIVWFAVH